jgi:hypothetical protein
MFIVLVVLCLAVLCGALAYISKWRSERSLFACGLALIVTGLACSLLGPLYAHGIDAVQTDYLKNSFLIIASIGANVVAASVLLPKQGTPACCCPAPGPTPTTIPHLVQPPEKT